MTTDARARAYEWVAGTDLILIVVLAVWRPFGPVVMILMFAALIAVAIGALVIPSLGSSTTRPSAFAVPVFTAPDPPRPAAVPVRKRWEQAVEQHGAVLSAYAAYELDPAMLLKYPAMWDLSASTVVDFHDALELAGSLRTDEFPGDEHAGDYIDAVSMLRTDWAKADKFARSTGTAHLGDDDARAARRALKLLNHADGTAGPERVSYLEQVLTTVDDLNDRGAISAPQPIHDELRARVQRAIEA
ncbi:MAG: hypothetical protein QM658_11040 [Gordonia sp. (in: high G+C Gram-positive bacteria)]